MANTTKTYTIEIQLDAAKQKVEDTTKKLAALDKTLEGLDRNSDAAKAIVAEMAKLAKEAESAEGQVQGLNSRLDGLKPGTIGALRQEFIELKAALDLTVEGSDEANRVLTRMGEVKGEIKGLRDEVKALDPEKRIGAFNNLAQGVVGAFGVMTVAAETFGLESSTADEFVKKTQGVIAVLASLEAIRNAADGETIKSIKSTIALGNAYIFSGTAAEGASRTTRAALLATGIGAILVLVGLLASNFDKVKEAGNAIYERFKPQFEAIRSLISTVADEARNLASAVTFGLVDDAAKHAVVVAQETADKLLAIRIKSGEDEIALRKAQGLRTEQEELEHLQNLVKLARSAAKSGDAEKKQDLEKAESDLAVFRATLTKKSFDEEDAERLARLNARASNEAAQGKDALLAQLAVKHEELVQLLAADTVNGAAVIAKQAEIDDLKAAHAKAAADKIKAEREKQIQKEYADFLKRNKELEKLQIIDYAERLRRDIEAEKKRQEEIAKAGQLAASAASRITEQLAAEAAERARIKALPPNSITDNVLVRVFGLAANQIDATKASLAQSFDVLGNVLNNSLGAMLAEGLSAADASIQAAQARLSELDQQLSEVSGKRQTDEQALATATGGRRDYLIQRIRQERAEESRLASEKAKASQAEERAFKEKSRLEKEQQRLVSISILLTNSATAASAIQAGVDAVVGANKLPFPANLVAIIAALAATGAAIASAKGLANSFEDGGLVNGPRHSEGGIQMWHKDGAHLGEFEGGEYIVNREATAKNFGLLQMINEAGRTRVLPPPVGMFAEGGVVGGAGLPAGAVVVQSADLAELVETNRAMLAHLETLSGFGPPVLEFGYDAEIKRRKLSGDLDNVQATARI